MSSLLDPKSKEPLFPLILEEIGRSTRSSDSGDGGNDGGGGSSNGRCGADHDPTSYIGGSEHPDYPCPDRAAVDAARLADFWARAHELSCLRRGSLSSSVEVTYNDAMATSLDGQVCLHGEMANVSDYNRALHLDFARTVLGGSDVCGHIASDGTLANDNNDSAGTQTKQCYRAAFCMHPGNGGGNAPYALAEGLASANERQMDAVARLSGWLLLAQTGTNIVDNATELHPEHTHVKSPSGGSWLQGPMAIASKVSDGVSYAIDRVLAAYDGDGEHLAGTTEPNEWDDARNCTAALEDEDDSERARTGTAREDRALGNSDEVISLTVVASLCRQLLRFVQAPRGEGSDGHVFLRGHREGVEWVMLYQKGWGVCSFGSLCRNAGRHVAADGSEGTERIVEEKERRRGDILSTLSQKGVGLLLVALCRSNHALVEKDIVTIFPGGIPSGYEPCESDSALFQIHVTKVTIDNRMARLERDADAAKASALTAQRNKTTKSALVFMRRRKAALDEVERCAALVTNLDAAELRLERAKDDAQVVQSYKLLKTALRDVRASSDVDSENVEELMSDLREEMDDAGGMGGAAVPGVVIDEDELNRELEMLELECKSERSAGNRDQADGKDNGPARVHGPPPSAEAVYESKTEAVPA